MVISVCSGQMGHQVLIQFLKIVQTDGPHGLVHRPHHPAVNKRNHTIHEGLLEAVAGHGVWTSSIILHIEQVQDKQTNEGRHAPTVEWPPRFLPPLIHADGLPVVM